jgi:ATP/maltotriose-dependent transcriptional regulator MalT
MRPYLFGFVLFFCASNLPIRSQEQEVKAPGHYLFAWTESSDNEAAATYQMSLAQSEVAFGFSQLARNDIAAAIQLAPTRDTRALAANVMALTGNIAEAEKIATDLARENPEDTNIAKILVPTIRASIELQRGNPEKVVEFLKTVTPYELGSDDNLYSAYLRGRAFLILGRGTDAAWEFQKQLGHRPIYQKNERAVLCQLGLARAYALQADSVKTRAAYEIFSHSGKTATRIFRSCNKPKSNSRS